MKCKAKAKGTGKKCKNNAVTGYEVCRMHGANPSNRGGGPRPGNKSARKHGLYSNALQGEELEIYETHQDDASLDNEIALLKAKIHRMLRLDPDNVDALGRAVDMLRKAVLAKHQTDPKDDKDGLGLIRDLMETMQGGKGDGA